MPAPFLDRSRSRAAFAQIALHAAGGDTGSPLGLRAAEDLAR